MEEPHSLTHKVPVLLLYKIDFHLSQKFNLLDNVEFDKV